MLERTFRHCPGVGAATEAGLWRSGVRTWSDVIAGRAGGLVSRGLAIRLEDTAAESVVRLRERDARWFARSLARQDHWRAVEAFADGIAFLDIETTGSYASDVATVIGIHDGNRLHQFVRNENIRAWLDRVSDRTLLVTFAGSSFDLPFLRREFGVPLDLLHVDLCPILRRLGYAGGLKAVEERLGLMRPAHTAGLSGMDAVRLWFEWENNGLRGSLDRLMAYNAEDVCNLRRLLDFAVSALRRLTFGEVEAR
jgi:uncharacterized protein YprB with RNaseH-like and TPR domain